MRVVINVNRHGAHDDESMCMCLSPQTPVCVLKRRIEESTGIPAAHQLLTNPHDQNHELRDAALLGAPPGHYICDASSPVPEELRIRLQLRVSSLNAAWAA